MILKICRHYRVFGRVQGVFFRVSTRDIAQGIGLTGWVRNTHDGAVELKACGSELELVQFEKWLWQGPSQSRVESIDIQPAESGDERGFEIRS